MYFVVIYAFFRCKFYSPKMVPKVSKWGFVLKSGLRIMIRPPRVPFSGPPKRPKWVILLFWGYRNFALWVITLQYGFMGFQEKKGDSGGEWTGWYPLDCYSYESGCGAKKSTQVKWALFTAVLRGNVYEQMNQVDPHQTGNLCNFCDFCSCPTQQIFFTASLKLVCWCPFSTWTILNCLLVVL